MSSPDVLRSVGDGGSMIRPGRRREREAAHRATRAARAAWSRRCWSSAHGTWPITGPIIASLAPRS